MDEEAPMMMEAPSVEPEKELEPPLQVLAVLSSHDDDFQPWDKIVTSKAFTDNHNANKFEIKSTTYDKFLDGKMKDKFEVVLLVFMGAVSRDDLEMKQDYYDYYTGVPIVHYSFAKLKQDEEEMKGVKEYLFKTVGKRLFKNYPLLFNDLNDTEKCVQSLYSSLNDLKKHKDEIFEKHVLPSFNKFDKDGNGTIDLQELGMLSKELGQPLNEEQLQAAMTDLDLNGDGVVDKTEFSRWYFTGMKAYNGTTRNMLQLRNQTSTIFDILAKEEIQQIIKDDKTLTKHQVKVQFNEPPQDHYIEATGHLLGPFTNKMREVSEEFEKQLGDEVTPYVGEKTARIYMDLDISMKPGQKEKYQGFCDRYNEFIQSCEFPRGNSYKPEPHVKFFAHDDKIVVKSFILFPDNISPLKDFDIPIGLKEGLKDVDQFAKVKILTGVDAKEILTSGKPLAEHALNGFSVQLNICFLKKIKKAIMTGMEGTQFADKIKEVLTMGGPGFSVGSNFALQLNFKEMEEIKAHPMASQLLITVDQLLQMVAQTDQQGLKDWKPDFSEVPEEELTKHIEGSEYCKEKKKWLDYIKLNTDILAEFNENCKLHLRQYIFDIGSSEVTVSGHGYGELVSLIVQAATFGFRKDSVERIVSDYKNTKDEAEKKDEMKDEEKKDDMVADEDMM